MEHGRFDYSPIKDRAPITLPGGKRVAIWVTPNVEHFEYGKPAMSITPMTMGMKPDVLNYAWRDYGQRVGIWRLMEVLERTGVTATAAVNSEACTRYPRIIEEGNRLGWEWMAHGHNNSSFYTGMPEDVERPLIRSVVDTIAAATGKSPRGWLSPGLTETDNTLDILAGCGIDYVADWCNDDQPYRMRTKSEHALHSIPYTIELSDIPIFLMNGASGDQFYQTVIDQFEVLYEEGRFAPRVMALSLHPFICGHPYRSKHLERALSYLAKHEGAWLTTGSAIIDHWTKTA